MLLESYLSSLAPTNTVLLQLTDDLSEEVVVFVQRPKGGGLAPLPFDAVHRMNSVCNLNTDVF